MIKKKPLVTILVGPPGSGKSTYVSEQKLAATGTVVISRDHYRKALYGNYKSDEKLEKLVTVMHDDGLLAAVKAGFDVILDATHCNRKTIESILNLLEGKAFVKHVNFEVDKKELLRRNETRPEEKRVPESVITRMMAGHKAVVKDGWIANKIKEFNLGPVAPDTMPHDPSLPDCIIVDIDGTVAHMEDLRGPFEWHNVDRDKHDEKIVKLVGILSKQFKVIFVSGRDGSCRDLTKEWLDAYVGVDYDLYMRPAGDFRKDNLIKREIFDQKIRGKYNVFVVLDDRNQVVKEWRRMGLKCLQVAEGDF